MFGRHAAARLDRRRIKKNAMGTKLRAAILTQFAHFKFGIWELPFLGKAHVGELRVSTAAQQDICTVGEFQPLLQEGQWHERIEWRHLAGLQAEASELVIAHHTAYRQP